MIRSTQKFEYKQDGIKRVFLLTANENQKVLDMVKMGHDMPYIFDRMVGYSLENVSDIEIHTTYYSYIEAQSPVDPSYCPF